MIYLDTHVVIWLAAGRTEVLSPEVAKKIEDDDLMISAASVLELALLHEIGRLTVPAATLVRILADELGVSVCDLPFHSVVDQALAETWVRDPFDRLIVANAKAREAPLITKDRRMRRHYSRALW